MNYYSYELNRLGYEEVNPLDFYRDIFSDGELAPHREKGDYRTGEYSAIALCVSTTDTDENTSSKTKRKFHRYTITDDFDNLDFLMYSNDFCFMSPISYAGKHRSSENARFMYALCIEIDNLCVQRVQTFSDLKEEEKEKYNICYNEKADKYYRYEYIGLKNLIDMFGDKVPTPTYIVASGSGIHLYYVFEQAVPLFKNIVREITKYKKALTKKLWNKKVTNSYREEDIQYESIFQGFRIPGTFTKAGLKTKNRTDDITTVHRVGEKLSIEKMNLYVAKASRMQTIYKSKLTLAEAKDKYPEWYQKRIVEKQDTKNSWTCNRAVYDWWKNRILTEARVGHRYYCMMMLSIYAIKCDIDITELEEDCFHILNEFEKLTENEDNHFTEKDVLDALQVYDDKGYVTYPINSIQNRSGLVIEKNKRNGRKKLAHLEYMRDIKQSKLKRNECSPGGRPNKAEIVEMWQLKNPNGKKADCIRDTGLTKPTVYKWWNDKLCQDNSDRKDDIITF